MLLSFSFVNLFVIHPMSVCGLVCSATRVVVSVSPAMNGSVSVNTLVVDPRGTNKIELH